MVLLRSCCCRLSLRKGSFACGIYTLVFYTMMIATGACHISSELLFSVGFTLVFLLLTLSGLCAVFSVVLLLGLYTNNRLLLLPWLTFVPLTTLYDISLSFYFIKDIKINGFVIAMHVVDYIFCSVNVYCIVCVLSLYQQYAPERRAVGRTTPTELPAVLPLRNRNNRGAGDRSAFGHTAAWVPNLLCLKAAFAHDTAPSDARSTSGGATATTDGARKADEDMTSAEGVHSLTPEVHKYSANELSRSPQPPKAETFLHTLLEEPDFKVHLNEKLFFPGHSIQHSGDEERRPSRDKSKRRSQELTVLRTVPHALISNESKRSV
ncbi:uncharacterized protein LOC144130449 isoform X2 [Amblyomma americanum]